MSDLVEGVSVDGDLPPVRLEEVNLTAIEAGESGSPVMSFPPKKMLRRPRGWPVKSRPKSPLMRMAENRRYGLRGRELRQVGKLGSDDYEARNRGKKGCGNRVAELLNYILEIGEEGDKINDGMVAEMVENQKADSLVLNLVENSTKQVWQKEALPAGSLGDSALDLVAAQPLQEMGFVAEQVRSVDLVGGSSWSLGMELNL